MNEHVKRLSNPHSSFFSSSDVSHTPEAICTNEKMVYEVHDISIPCVDTVKPFQQTEMKDRGD